MFSLGSEGLNIPPPRVALPSAVFTCLLVCVLYSENCRGYVSFTGSSELTPCGLTITWASGWWASKLCIRLCRNRSWRLPLRALRHRMWNSPNMLTICWVRWRNPLHILVIARGSGQMRIWSRISSRSRPTLICLKQDAHDKLGEPARWVMYEVDSTNCHIQLWTNCHIQLWTKFE